MTWLCTSIVLIAAISSANAFWWPVFIPTFDVQITNGNCSDETDEACPTSITITTGSSVLTLACNNETGIDLKIGTTAQALPCNQSNFDVQADIFAPQDRLNIRMFWGIKVYAECSDGKMTSHGIEVDRWLLRLLGWRLFEWCDKWSSTNSSDSTTGTTQVIPEVCQANFTFDPCPSPARRAYAEAKCAVIKNPAGPFKDCNTLVDDLDRSFEKCVVSVCRRRRRICSALTHFARECGREGTYTDWRKAAGCKVRCPRHARWTVGVKRDCVKTCHNKNPCPEADNSTSANTTAVDFGSNGNGTFEEGCVCKSRYVWDHRQASCVRPDECDVFAPMRLTFGFGFSKCARHHGHYFRPGSGRFHDTDCSKFYIAGSDGNWIEKIISDVYNCGRLNCNKIRGCLPAKTFGSHWSCFDSLERYKLLSVRHDESEDDSNSGEGAAPIARRKRSFSAVIKIFTVFIESLADVEWQLSCPPRRG